MADTDRVYALAGSIFIDTIKRPIGKLYSELLCTGFLYEGNIDRFDAEEAIKFHRSTHAKAEVGDYDWNTIDDRKLKTFNTITAFHKTIRAFMDEPGFNWQTFGHMYLNKLLGNHNYTPAGGSNAIEEFFTNSFDSSIEAVERLTDRQVYRQIFEDHLVKIDGTGTALEGSKVSFNEDTGWGSGSTPTKRDPITQKVDLTDTAKTSEQKADELKQELYKAIRGTMVGYHSMWLAADDIYMLIPQSVGDAYFSVFESKKDQKLTRAGLEMSDGTMSFLHSFTAFNLKFVCLPDDYFLAGASTGTPATGIRALILPRNSIACSLPNTHHKRIDLIAPQYLITEIAKVTTNLTQKVLDPTGIVRWQRIDSRGQDPMLLQNKQGVLRYPIETLKAKLEMNPTDNKTVAQGLSYEHFRTIGMRRIAPQYIQEFIIPANFIPASFEGLKKEFILEPTKSRAKSEGMM
jgi:hypothetical protein